MDEPNGETSAERSEETGGPEKRYYGFVTSEPWGFTETEWSAWLVEHGKCMAAKARIAQVEDRGVEGLY